MEESIERNVQRTRPLMVYVKTADQETKTIRECRWDAEHGLRVTWRRMKDEGGIG